MAGKFVKGAWVEEEERHERRIPDYSFMKPLIDKFQKDLEDHKQRMYMTGIRARKAGFMARLKYLFTRKI